ncbi:hypothetical protein QYF36_009461 [Acer negundo]|nr:hypothetical protein QYF36_009461 [Acer negundo]
MEWRHAFLTCLRLKAIRELLFSNSSAKEFFGSPLLQPPPTPRFFSNSLTGLASVLSSYSQPSSAVINCFTVPIAAPEWCSKMCHGFISTMEEFRVTMKSTRSSLLVLEDTIASPNFTLEKVNRLLDSVNRYVLCLLTS